MRQTNGRIISYLIPNYTMVKLLSRTEHGTTAWSKLYWERFISCLVDVSGRALARLQLTGSGRSHVILQDTFAKMCVCVCMAQCLILLTGLSPEHIVTLDTTLHRLLHIILVKDSCPMSRCAMAYLQRSTSKIYRLFYIVHVTSLTANLGFAQRR